MFIHSHCWWNQGASSTEKGKEKDKEEDVVPVLGPGSTAGLDCVEEDVASPLERERKRRMPRRAGPWWRWWSRSWGDITYKRERERERERECVCKYIFSFFYRVYEPRLPACLPACSRSRSRRRMNEEDFTSFKILAPFSNLSMKNLLVLLLLLLLLLNKPKQLLTYI